MKKRADLVIAARRWKSDVCAFVEEALVDPETGEHFRLYAEQREFLQRAFKLTPDGRMPYTELCYSAGKKSGKTATAAFIVIYTAVHLAPPRGELYLLANDLEQSTSRVFKAVAAILAASPLLRRSTSITANRITFKSTGTTIIAVANDYRGFAGANPTLNVFDESAYYVSESSHRLWAESVPSPARRISFRLSVSTAGFEGEPSPLRELYDRAMTYGCEVAPDLYVHENLLCFWSNRVGLAPWQTQAWTDEMARTLRGPQFRRLICNEWVSSESSFIEMPVWDSCVDPDTRPLAGDKSLRVWVGMDLGWKHDSTALVVVALDGDVIQLVDHIVFTPTKSTPLDVEATAEAAVRSIAERFDLACVGYDPWQAVDLTQRLTRAHLSMVPIAQSPQNQTPMASQLIDVLKQGRLRMYASRELRDAAAKTIVVESSRGYRLGKAKGSDRVDPIIALAMAVLLAGREESTGSRYEMFDFFTGERQMPSANQIDDMTGLPIVRVRPPNFQSMARPEVESDPDAPKHPGVTIWDFIDARGLDKDDPTTEQAHWWALEEYRKAMVEYRAAKAAKKAAATAVDTPDVVRS
jgi:phage terminase large subunit-like protein